MGTPASDVHLNALMDRVTLKLHSLTESAYRRAIAELIGQVVGFFEASMSPRGRALAGRTGQLAQDRQHVDVNPAMVEALQDQWEDFSQLDEYSSKELGRTYRALDRYVADVALGTVEARGAVDAFVDALGMYNDGCLRRISAHRFAYEPNYMASAEAANVKILMTFDEGPPSHR